jgi:peptidoglycan-N-acetylmuramic acid deacetylase
MIKLLSSLCAGIMLATIAFGVTCTTQPAEATVNAPIVNWGMSPNTREQTPTPPEWGAELLEKHNGIFVADTEEKVVYLTFDLGYEAGYTAQVLDTLKQHNIKGIFFLCGNYLQHKELIQRMIDEGHTIGNHTDRHKDLPKLSDENIKKDIVDFQTKYEAAGFTAPIKHFRPPQGRIDERSMKITADLDLKTVMWSIAIVDWGKQPIDATASAKKIASRIHPGAIVLLHITNAGTPKMMDLLIPQILEKGYTFGDAGQL